jgi:hypothetical protein
MNGGENQQTPRVEMWGKCGDGNVGTDGKMWGKNVGTKMWGQEAVKKLFFVLRQFA